MKEVFFTGVVHPQRALLTLPQINIKIFLNDDILLGHAHISIDNSQVMVLFEIHQDNYDILTIRNSILDLVQNYINLFDFMKGYSHHAEIIQCVEGKKPPIVFGVSIDAIGSLGDDNEINDLIPKLLSLTNDTDGQFFSRCLHDLSLAISRPIDTGFYLSRALESLCRFVGDKYDIPEECDQRKYLGEKLNITKEDTKKLQHHGTQARHGKHIPMTAEDRAEFFTQAYDIVDKFIIWQFKEMGIEPSIPRRVRGKE
jgi:hypothetical protein